VLTWFPLAHYLHVLIVTSYIDAVRGLMLSCHHVLDVQRQQEVLLGGSLFPF
jgi:hypothetical protein